MARYPKRSRILFLCALLVGAVTPTQAQCPESHIRVTYGGVANYDLPASWMDARTTELVSSQADLRVVDDFELTHLPLSATVPCTVRLILTGSLAAATLPHFYAGGYAQARIIAESDSVEFYAFNATPEDRSVDAVLDLPVVLTAGTPVRLAFHIFVFTDVADTGSYVRGDIQLVGLPPNAGVRSCTGFVLDPVAVMPQTWSRVKELYRVR